MEASTSGSIVVETHKLLGASCISRLMIVATDGAPSKSVLRHSILALLPTHRMMKLTRSSAVGCGMSHIVTLELL